MVRRITTYVVLGTCLALGYATGCAQTTDVTRVDPAPTPIDRTPRLTRAQVVELREEIDRDGLRAECKRYEDASGSRAWLGTWCGWRSQDWSLVQALAPDALSHFEARSQTRRQIEVLLLHAIARVELDQSGGRQLADRAYHLWRWSKMPIHGPRTDLFAGDFPYLVAEALERGLVPPADDLDRRPTRKMMLDIADFEYASFERMVALPHVDRTRVRWALEMGELRAAIAHLVEAFELDRASENLAGLDANFDLFARFARLAGLGDAAHAVQGWIEFEPLVIGPEPPSEQTSRLDVAPMLRTRRGRDELTDTIRHLRRSASSAIRPPQELVEGLRAVRNMDVIKGDSWALAYQAGELLREQGYRSDARRFLRRGIELVEQMRSSLPTPALRQQFFADKRPLYMALVDIYVGIDTENLAQTDYETALILANQLKARGLHDLLTRRIPPERSTETEATDWVSHESPLETSDMIIDHLERWNVDASTTSRLRPSTPLSAIPAELDQHTAVVEYLLAPRRSYAWVITDDGIEMRRLTGREDIEPRVREFMALSSRPKLDAAQTRRIRALAERLYVDLIGPVEDVVVDRDRLVIAPDRLLYQLPFEALGIPTRGSATPWLVERHTISYVPSSHILALLAGRDRSATGSSALVIGNPDLDRSAIGLLPYAPQLPDDGAFNLEESFPPLRSADSELRAVRRAADKMGLSDVEVRQRDQATEAGLMDANLASYRWIHIAAHGVSDATSLRPTRSTPVEFEQPALLLAVAGDRPHDGVLTLAEVLTLETSAELAVLSGCSTGRGWRALGEGAFGLAGALLYTGTSTVVASTWDVGDRATAELMSTMYAALADGQSAPDALRTAQLRMLRKPETASPFFWAPFRAIGYRSLR